MAIGKIATRWSTKKLLDKMGWLNISQILNRETAITTHKIINNRQPEHMSYKMLEKYKNKTPITNTRTTGPGKARQ